MLTVPRAAIEPAGEAETSPNAPTLPGRAALDADPAEQPATNPQTPPTPPPAEGRMTLGGLAAEAEAAHQPVAQTAHPAPRTYDRAPQMPVEVAAPSQSKFGPAIFKKLAKRFTWVPTFAISQSLGFEVDGIFGSAQMLTSSSLKWCFSTKIRSAFGLNPNTWYGIHVGLRFKTAGLPRIRLTELPNLVIKLGSHGTSM